MMNISGVSTREKNKQVKFILKNIIFYMILIPGFTFLVGDKNINRWVDHQTYENYFFLATYNNYAEIFRNGVDPVFVSLMRPFTPTTEGFGFFLIVCAYITLTLKLMALRRSTNNFFIFMLLYSAYFLCLHDYIQIRISLAMAFVALGIYYSQSKRSSFLFFFVSSLIHLTSVFVIIPYLIYKYCGRTAAKFLILGSIFLPLILFSGIIHNARLDTYISFAKYKEAHYDANPFSSQPLLQLAGVIYIYYRSKLRKEVIDSYEYFISIIGVICFYGMLKVPVLSFRLFEMTMFFYIILLSRIFNKSKVIIVICVLFILVGLKNMFYGSSALLIINN
ncbi:capsular polysaccharide biosynthesis protein [Dickeya dadantii 3937]|uniref:Capsular polysaccharide biosynthesis protein n=2 Tax=Dickeya dadantii TaxID=204038 RepID=E0SFU5_DICD3|nr:capsular polysaccharide biosynthesis protein [Dickeya dadantii 3937]